MICNGKKLERIWRNNIWNKFDNKNKYILDEAKDALIESDIVKACLNIMILIKI